MFPWNTTASRNRWEHSWLSWLLCAHHLHTDGHRPACRAIGRRVAHAAAAGDARPGATVPRQLLVHLVVSRLLPVLAAAREPWKRALLRRSWQRVEWLRRRRIRCARVRRARARDRHDGGIHPGRARRGRRGRQRQGRVPPWRKLKRVRARLSYARVSQGCSRLGTRRR